jgi:hypothetical protein
VPGHESVNLAPRDEHHATNFGEYQLAISHPIVDRSQAHVCVFGCLHGPQVRNVWIKRDILRKAFLLSARGSWRIVFDQGGVYNERHVSNLKPMSAI